MFTNMVFDKSIYLAIHINMAIKDSKYQSINTWVGWHCSIIMQRIESKNQVPVVVSFT